jgi:hypothetical protein
MRLRFAACGLRLLALAAVLACAPGCEIAGVVAHAIGPPAVEALYTPAQTPMLVLAENFANPSSGQIEAEQLERFVIDELTAHAVAPMADYEAVYSLRANEPARFRAMSIDQLGKLAGAAQVLYINLQLSTTAVAENAEAFQGSASVTVRIIDVETGRTLWPEQGSEGYPLHEDSRMVRKQPGVNDAAVRRDLQRSLAYQIGQLFYKYKPE